MANGTTEHISDWGRALRIQGYLGCVISQDFLVVFLLLKYVYTVEIVAMLFGQPVFAYGLQRDLLAVLTGS